MPNPWSCSPAPGSGAWSTTTGTGPGAARHVQDRRGVNCLGDGDPVLFDEDLRTGIAQAEYQVAVEADQIDVKAREGWSC